MPVQMSQGRRAAIVSGHRLATLAASDVLRDGGNVVDAAVAGAAMLAVALPHACGLGGDCFILLHQAGATYCINGSGPSPARLPDGLSKEQLSIGPLSCAVPGMLRAWDDLHRRFGKRAWRDLLEPAIALARDGVTPSPDLAKALDASQRGLASDPGCRALFLSDRATSNSAAKLRQPALAEALAQVAEERSSALYRGALGASLCRASAERGGVLSPEDLRAYQPLWAEPLQWNYRGSLVRVAPPNSFGLLMLLSSPRCREPRWPTRRSIPRNGCGR